LMHSSYMHKQWIKQDTLTDKNYNLGAFKLKAPDLKLRFRC